ncbi:MAG: serine protease [Thermoanaerobaculia bacterium]|nr:serine protease [Thermoanaerobaculia bacterium]
MNEELKKSIVRIEVAGSRGTGFVVRFERRDPQSAHATVWVLTALHVVADLKRFRESGPPLMWRASTANVRLQPEVSGLPPREDVKGEVLSFKLSDKTVRTGLPDDWALLRYEGDVVAPTIPPLRLLRFEDACKRDQQVWSTFGYSEAQPQKGGTHFGEILLSKDDEIELYDVVAAAGSGGFVSGLSGAPCVFEGHVVGILVEALQKDRQSVHAKVYALPIERVAAACGLALAPGEQDFEADVRDALQNVTGTTLVRLAGSLNVPPMEEEDALRLHTARALILAPVAKLQDALDCCVGRLTGAVVDMVHCGKIEEASVAQVRGCHKFGSPKGIAAISTVELTARLLVLRALGDHMKMPYYYGYVKSGACDAKAWSSMVRRQIIGILRSSEDEFANDEDLSRAIIELYGKNHIIIGFQFNAWESPLDVIERYPKLHALAMLSPDQAGAFARAGYAIVCPLNELDKEVALMKSHKKWAHFAVPKS